MKLVIQIPCHNEELTLPLVLEKIPKSIEGISKIEIQIINDGSTDNTEAVAKKLGIDHIIRIPGKNRRWLGRAFRVGVDAALSRDADIIVNTDGDNQYPSEKIPDLVKPILDGIADIVIGDRSPSKFSEFSFQKRILQKSGNIAASLVTGEDVKDAVCGFRAYSKRAALQIHILTNFTYTVDSLIQAYKKGLDVSWITITPNSKTRESRLITSLLSKVRKSGTTILRISTVYEPFKIFLTIAIIFLLPAVFYIGRFLYIYLFYRSDASGHVQSLVLGGACAVIAIQIFVLGIITELLAVNRQLLENSLTRIKSMEIDISHLKKND